jgi:hypothetical protein
MSLEASHDNSSIMRKLREEAEVNLATAKRTCEAKETQVKDIRRVHQYGLSPAMRVFFFF